ncbi:MAG: serine hydrolase [Saprospiraceae bacterium]|nr:serine hydrolase [Saprospiraceae bacterium]
MKKQILIRVFRILKNYTDNDYINRIICSFMFFLLFQFHIVHAQDYSRLSNASENQIDNYVQFEMANQDMVGVSIGVIRNGDIVYLKGYGHADKACDIAATPNTLYRIASISKTFTAMVALQLWEEGKLDLQADIRNYVPEYPIKPEGVITTEHLLSNESGMQHYAQVNSYNTLAMDLYIRDHINDYDPIAAIEIFKDQPLIDTPGHSYNYTTFGFNLAAAVIERADSTPFEDQVKTGISDIADMPTFQPMFRGKAPFYNQALGYRDSNGNIIVDKGGNADYDDVTFKLGGGGWIASVRDLTHFVKAFINDDLLDPATTTFMGTNHTPANGSDYCLGLWGTIRNGDTLLYHSGNQVWTSTLIYFSPENHNGVVIMTNNRSSSVFPLAQLIYDNIPSLVVSGAVYNNPIPDSLAVVNLLSPQDFSIGQNSSVWLKWSPIDYAKNYKIEIADNPNYNNSSVLSSITDSVAVNGLQSNQNYYWRVRALNEDIYNGIAGNWSTTFQFSTASSIGFNPLPFLENFESFNALVYLPNDNVYRGLGYYWSFDNDDVVGRAKFGHWSITNNGGKGALTLDGLSTNGQVYCSKFATLTLDLSMHTSANDLELSFDYIQHGEESHLDDRIWIRGDSNNVWIEIYDWFANRQPDGVLKQVTGIDIDSFLQTNGQVPTNSFQLIFGQHDNSYAENVSAKDGVTFDNIFIVNASMVPFSKPEDELALLPVIYPNPVLNEITIRGIDQGKLKLVDPLGHSLLEKSINSATTIDISAIKKGVYFATLEYDNRILIRKIVKR